MLIVTDEGNEMVNADQVFAFSAFAGQDGQWMLVANGGALWQSVPIRTLLVMGSRARCERALQHIADGARQRRHILDLRDCEGVGQRPQVQAVETKIILPGDGEGRPQ